MLELMTLDATGGTIEGVCLELLPGGISAEVLLERTSDVFIHES